MILTVGRLKEILSELSDDVILADLDYGNDEFHSHNGIKRLLLLQDKDGQKYLTINRMGSHFSEHHSKKKLLKYAGKYWDK